MQAVRRDDDCPADALCLAVTPQAWYLRLVVPPIELTYARDSRRLLRRLQGEPGELADELHQIPVHRPLLP